MPLYTVTVTSGTEREVYGGLTACQAYILDMVGEGAVAFRALSAGGDDQKRLLIEATRYIDRHKWKGTANAAGGTVLKWPRDDIEDADGDAVSDADQLALIEQATFELVAILAGDNAAKEAADQSSNVKSMGAGKARLEFFGPTSTKNGTATKLPTVVHDLIGLWLEVSGSAGLVSLGGYSTGTDAESHFDDCDDGDLGGPL